MIMRYWSCLKLAGGRPWAKYLPILTWAGNYDKKWLSGDVASGLSVGSIIVAQGMAYAVIANVPAIYGLYAGLVSLILYGFLGTCGQLSVAPVAILALIVREGAAKLAPIKPGDSEEQHAKYVEMCMMIIFLAGIIQLLLGMIRFGRVTKFISRPVISGFTTASALIIAASQLKMATGINAKPSDRFFEVIYSVLENITTAHLQTVIMAFGTVSFLLLVSIYNKDNKKLLPGALMAVVSCTILSYLLDVQALGVRILGSVPTGLPSFNPIGLGLQDVTRIWHPALAIALVSFIESISVANKMADTFDYKVDENQELIALGAIHVVGACFNALPVAGGISRSAVTANAGAKTPLSSLVAGGLVLASLLVLADFVFFMPMNTLAAVVLVACLSLMDLDEGLELYRSGNRPEFAVWAISVGATLLIGVENGIIVSVFASIAIVFYGFAEPSVHISTNSHLDDEEEATASSKSSSSFVSVVRVEAPLLFCNADLLREKLLLAGDQTSPSMMKRRVVLDCSRSFEIDSTALSTLERVSRELSRKRTPKKNRSLGFLKF